MDRRYKIIVFFAITIIEERLLPCLEDILARERPCSLEHARRLENIECISKISISEVCDEREGICFL